MSFGAIAAPKSRVEMGARGIAKLREVQVAVIQKMKVAITILNGSREGVHDGEIIFTQSRG